MLDEKDKKKHILKAQDVQDFEFEITKVQNISRNILKSDGVKGI